MSEQLLLPPILESLWWVIPNLLAGVRKPAEEDLLVLQALQVRAVVSVLSDDANLELYRRHNIPYLWIPIAGGTAPSLSQLQQLKAFVDSQNDSGKAVAVHCSNGLRRIGTVLAALLIRARG